LNICHRISPCSATALDIAQFVVRVLKGYANAPVDTDFVIEDANLFIKELRPTIFELTQALRVLKTEREDPRFCPSFQEIRNVVKRFKRDTVVTQLLITNIQRAIEDKPPLVAPAHLLVDDQRFLEALEQPALPQRSMYPEPIENDCEYLKLEHENNKTN